MGPPFKYTLCPRESPSDNLSLLIPEAVLLVYLNLSLSVLIIIDLLMKSKVLAFAGKGFIVCMWRNVSFWCGMRFQLGRGNL